MYWLHSVFSVYNAFLYPVVPFNVKLPTLSALIIVNFPLLFLNTFHFAFLSIVKLCFVVASPTPVQSFVISATLAVGA